ncbi:hypothetical protein RUND412_003254 [Rhizina undulata]
MGPKAPKAIDFDFEFLNSQSWDVSGQTQARVTSDIPVQRTRALGFGSVSYEAARNSALPRPQPKENIKPAVESRNVPEKVPAPITINVSCSSMARGNMAIPVAHQLAAPFKVAPSNLAPHKVAHYKVASPQDAPPEVAFYKIAPPQVAPPKVASPRVARPTVAPPKVTPTTVSTFRPSPAVGLVVNRSVEESSKPAASRPSPAVGPAVNRPGGESSRANQAPEFNYGWGRFPSGRRGDNSPAGAAQPAKDEFKYGRPKYGEPKMEPFNFGDRYGASKELRISPANNNPNVYSSDSEEEELAIMQPDGFFKDNDADRAERAQQPRDSTFDLPLQTTQAFEEMFFGIESHNLRHIGAKTSTHLRLHQEEPIIEMWGNPDQIARAKRDLQALLEHVRLHLEGNRKRTGGHWEKIKMAPTEQRAIKLISRARGEARRRRFRHMPEEGTWFNAVGVFICPYSDPEMLLGANFEFLDQIRYDCEVYILYSFKKQMFRVLGDDQKNVAQALDRIFAVFCELAAFNRKPIDVCLAEPPVNLRGTSVMITKKHELMGKQAHLKSHGENLGIMTYLSGPEPSKKFLELWKSKAEKLRRANNFYMKRIMQQALGDAYYTRKYCNLKIYFGKMVLFGYKKPDGGEYGLLEWCEMLREPQVEAEVIRSIGEDVAKELIDECNQAPEIFHPVEAAPSAFTDLYQLDRRDSGSEDGIKIEETLSATLDITLYDDKGSSTDVRLEIKFERIPGKHPDELTNDAGELYKAGMRRWLQLPTTNKGPSTSFDRKQHQKDSQVPDGFTRRTGPADIKVSDVENEVAWQMELVTYPVYRDAVSFPIFSEFERRLHIEEIADESDPRGPPAPGEKDVRNKVKRIQYANLPGLEVTAVTIKTKWSYWINRTSYIFEVTKYEYIVTDMVNRLYQSGMSGSFKGLKIPTDTRWGVSLWNDEWRMALSQQMGLGVGITAAWECDAGKFFKSSSMPGWEKGQNGDVYMGSMEDGGEDQDVLGADPWEGDGWAELMERVREVVRMIRRARDRVEKKALGSVTEGSNIWDGLAVFDF